MSLQTDRPPHPADEPSSDVQSTDSTALSDDDIFHILQTNRRRDAIQYLLEKDEPVKMRDVAEYVAARENDTTVAKLSSTERQRVYIPLYQSHLPKLDKEGVIEYNQSRGIVRPTDQLELFRPYLAMQEDESTASAPGPGSAGEGEHTLRQRGTVLAVTGASLLLASAIGVSAALTAAETSFALAVAVGAVALPGMVLGTAVTALLAVVVGMKYTPSFIPNTVLSELDRSK